MIHDSTPVLARSLKIASSLSQVSKLPVGADRCTTIAAFRNCLFLILLLLASSASVLFSIHTAFAAESDGVGNGQAATDTPIPPETALEPDNVVVFGARILGDEDSTRLILDLDRKFSARLIHINNPDRLVVEGPTMIFSLPADEPLEARGLVSEIRYGAISEQKSRVVMNLQRPATIKKQVLEKLDDDGRYRLIVDFGSVEQSAFSQRIARDRELYGASGASARKGARVRRKVKQRGRFSIVIDPGHGGIDGGATGQKGTVEKQVTLDVALILSSALRKAGPFDVYLTRDDDVFMSLKDRVAFAKRKRADLFISIHADSLRQRSVRGATIYTLSRKASDKLAERVAASENRVDLVAGLAVPEETDVVVDILAELTTRETMRFSHGMSNILVETMKGRVNLIKNPQRSAAFGVLKAPEIPGVLLELGYLSNAEDEKLMRSQSWRIKVSDSITRSVKQFFAPRM